MATKKEETGVVEAAPIVTITAEELKRLLSPKSEHSAPDDRKLDEAVSGGRYKVGGVWRDANGKALSDQSRP